MYFLNGVRVRLIFREPLFLFLFLHFLSNWSIPPLFFRICCIVSWVICPFGFDFGRKTDSERWFPYVRLEKYFLAVFEFCQIISDIATGAVPRSSILRKTIPYSLLSILRFSLLLFSQIQSNGEQVFFLCSHLISPSVVNFFNVETSFLLCWSRKWMIPPSHLPLHLHIFYFNYNMEPKMRGNEQTSESRKIAKGREREWNIKKKKKAINFSFQLEIAMVFTKRKEDMIAGSEFILWSRILNRFSEYAVLCKCRHEHMIS